jgi:hypothetical protein
MVLFFVRGATPQDINQLTIFGLTMSNASSTSIQFAPKWEIFSFSNYSLILACNENPTQCPSLSE